MGPCRRKAGLWGGGDREVFYFPVFFFQECSLVSAAWRRPERASPIQPFIWHTKAISQEDKLSLPYSSLALLVVSSSLSLSHAHSHTRSQAVISMLMDVQENMNVNQWETRGEKTKQALGHWDRRPGNGSVSLYLWHSPGWLRLKALLTRLDCSETQLDPKAQILQTDECKRSQLTGSLVSYLCGLGLNSLGTDDISGCLVESMVLPDPTLLCVVILGYRTTCCCEFDSQHSYNWSHKSAGVERTWIKRNV